MAAGKIEELKSLVREFPELPGVYLMKNLRDKVIYVGKAKSLRARVRSYFNKSSDQPVKTQYLVNQIEQIHYILTNTEVEAFLLEASLIKKYRPRYNIRLKDDKAYPYIKVSVQDTFPRFYLSRRVESDGALYFGPYTSGTAVRETIRFLNRTFRVRDCADAFMKTRKRPCLTYQIGRCTAPCVGLIETAAYKADIDSALEYLRGEDKKVVKDLTRRMKSASEDERFEAAAKFRDSIQAIEAIWQRQSVVSTKQDRDVDVIAFFGDQRGTLIETLHIRRGRVIGNRSHFLPKLDVSRDGEDPREWLTSFLNQYYAENVIPDEIILPLDLGGDLHKLLGDVFWERQRKRPALVHALDQGARELMTMAEKNAENHFNSQITQRENVLNGLAEIQKKLHLPALPRRMECFDISNFQGSQTVASQVVFEEGTSRKEDYRKYKIKSVEGPNDFESMKEVLRRRLAHTEYEDPQLIVVDGGKGQLKMAVEVLKELGRPEIPVVGMAKARTEGEFSDQEIHESQERFFLPGRQNAVTFRQGSEALNILVQIRDEAHRVAITFHRKLRDQALLSSSLDQVKGLGPAKKKYLLAQFGSLEAIRKAEIEEIAELKGFNRSLAEGVLAALNADLERG
ncbi:MAG: excinuclease ABC subunit UvrC [Bdellovibrionales bacterium]|nr:excinuclease ABC subunit UvrC [Bdellovibrionales bacterium]